MILGHMAATYLVYENLFKESIQLSTYEQIPVIFICAYFPDIMDKSFNKLFKLPSRGIFHSLVILNLFLLLPFFFYPSPLMFFFITSVNLHVLTDLPQLKQLTHPIFSKSLFNFGKNKFSFLSVANSYYIQRAAPKTLIMEVVLITAAVSQLIIIY